MWIDSSCCFLSPNNQIKGEFHKKNQKFEAGINKIKPHWAARNAHHRNRTNVWDPGDVQCLFNRVSCFCQGWSGQWETWPRNQLSNALQPWGLGCSKHWIYFHVKSFILEILSPVLSSEDQCFSVLYISQLGMLHVGVKYDWKPENSRVKCFSPKLTLEKLNYSCALQIL